MEKDELDEPLDVCDLKFVESFDSFRSCFLLPFTRKLQLNVLDLEMFELDETLELLVDPVSRDDEKKKKQRQLLDDNQVSSK